VRKGRRQGNNDERILDLIRAGQILSQESKSCFYAALDLLSRDYRHLVYGFVKSSLPEPIQIKAEEITQEVFLAAYGAMPAFHEEGRIAPWLWKIARNKYYDALREARGREFSGTSNDNPLRDPEEISTQQEAWRIMQNCLQRLPVEDRLIITLRFHGVLGPKEIAEILGIQQSSMRQRYRRTMVRLQSMIKEHESS
jgi:RNA polymerase sigma-70 factor, ECF subfamily